MGCLLVSGAAVSMATDLVRVYACSLLAFFFLLYTLNTFIPSTPIKGYL